MILEDKKKHNYITTVLVFFRRRGTKKLQRNIDSKSLEKKFKLKKKSLKRPLMIMEAESLGGLKQDRLPTAVTKKKKVNMKKWLPKRRRTMKTLSSSIR